MNWWSGYMAINGFAVKIGLVMVGKWWETGQVYIWKMSDEHDEHPVIVLDKWTVDGTNRFREG
jgi:hypothetical protein